jgi:hypothetical protein
MGKQIVTIDSGCGLIVKNHDVGRRFGHELTEQRLIEETTGDQRVVGISRVPA